MRLSSFLASLSLPFGYVGFSKEKQLVTVRFLEKEEDEKKAKKLTEFLKKSQKFEWVVVVVPRSRPAAFAYLIWPAGCCPFPPPPRPASLV